MGDRFYAQQRAANGKGKRTDPKKPKRRLKKDIISNININSILGCGSIPSMDKMTIAGLDKLEDILKENLGE